MTFAHPALLLFLWAVPLAAALWVWMRRRSAARLSLLGLAPQARRAETNPQTRFGVQLALVALGGALAITAAARPRWGERDAQRRLFHQYDFGPARRRGLGAELLFHPFRLQH